MSCSAKKGAREIFIKEITGPDFVTVSNCREEEKSLGGVKTGYLLFYQINSTYETFQSSKKVRFSNSLSTIRNNSAGDRRPDISGGLHYCHGHGRSSGSTISQKSPF